MKRFGIALIVGIGMFILASPRPAEAGTRFGVYFGVQPYGYPPPPPPCPRYVSPYAGYYAYPQVYAPQVYAPYGYYYGNGWRRREWRRREWREHERRERRWRRHEGRGRGW